MARIAVPTSIKLKQVEHWSLSTTATTSGRGLDGRQQYIHRENRSWRCRYMVLDALQRGASMGDYLAFIDQLCGPANTFLVPIPSFNAFIPEVGKTLLMFDAGNQAFVDATNNAIVLDGDVNPVVSVTAPAGASIINLSGVDGALVNVGAHFSYLGYAYRVSKNEGGVVSFNPPLRKQIPADAVVNVASPSLRVRLAGDEAAAAAYQFAGLLHPYYLDVVEAFE